MSTKNDIQDSIKEIKPLSVSSAIVTPPPSKAHTLRSLILASLCKGKSKIQNALLAEDQKHLIACLENLGVTFTIEKNEWGENIIYVEGNGLPFQVKNPVLDCGESGVAMNFLTSLSCFANEPIRLTGKESLLKRPIDDLTKALESLGIEILFENKKGYPPLQISPSFFSNEKVSLSGKKTSQYFSSLSIAGALNPKGLEITCSDELSEKPYLDITHEMMKQFCVLAVHEEYKTIKVFPNQEYRPQNIIIEGDFSSASYFFLIAAIAKIDIKLLHLNMNSVQGDKKIIDFMRSFGCSIIEEKDGILIKGGKLIPVEIDCLDTPDLVPTLAVAAAFAEGKSILKNISQLRFKESNRLDVIRSELKKMNIDTEVKDENLIIFGSPKTIKGAIIDSYNDHRIAMSFAVPGLVLEGQKIQDPSCVSKSFPHFWELFDEKFTKTS